MVYVVVKTTDSFVVSYSNKECALPSEWSDVTTLNKGNLSMYHISYTNNYFIFMSSSIN